MRNKKQLTIIALIAVVAVCVQCAKSFDKNTEEEHASRSQNSKDKSLIAEGSAYFALILLGTKISGVAYCISIKQY